MIPSGLVCEAILTMKWFGRDELLLIRDLERGYDCESRMSRGSSLPLSWSRGCHSNLLPQKPNQPPNNSN
jgi:hypothetical protein